ncbi:MAG: TIGR03960 family B12-binding radical SAM protein, partial [Myxococcales bacterium]|nr:TIGR03960 family B12-binding radical SAM protein [Myxococcales bacterium]
MSHIYQEILGRVNKPVRYIGNEWNVIRKPWETTPNRVCLAFPDTYEIGMSHLGLRILYSLLNGDPQTLAERAYCPWPDMEGELRNANLPLVAMESQRPLRDFDVVGFSLQYEMEYTNVLTMLDLGGIPLYTAERQLGDPLVIGGGSCVFSPEPVADFFDCFLIGDGEKIFPQAIEIFCSMRRAGHSRRELLIALAQLPGMYVPSLYRTEIDPQTSFEVVVGSDVAPFPVKRTYIEDLSEYPFPTDILVPNTEIVHDRVSYEIARGCTEGYRFCQAGTIYRPVRERKPTEIVNAIQKSLEQTGYDGVSLTSLSTADYSCISPVLQSLVGELERSKTSVSVSSLRVYGLTETMAEEISKVRKTGFTIAPEAGTQRLRDVINKGISEKEILRGARTAFQKGWNRLKLYFMIGLPTETEEDLRGIVDLALQMVQIAKSEFNRRVSVTVSASTLIPKAHSPFQWCAMNDRETIRQKQDLLRTLIRPHRNVDLRLHDLETSYLEGVISRADRRLSKAIELAWRKGARFDAWNETFDARIWYEVFDELELGETIEAWLTEIPLIAPLPWDHIDSLVEKRFLIRELKRALANKFSPACEKPFKKYNSDRVDLADPEKDTGKPYVCYDCGLACDLDAIKAERQQAWKDVQGLKLK